MSPGRVAAWQRAQHRVSGRAPRRGRREIHRAVADPPHALPGVVLPWWPDLCPKCSNACLTEDARESSCLVCGWAQRVRAS